MFYLVKLHEIKHFSRAAKACQVTQSTLSIGIQNLEKQLNMPLLERNHKSFVFTAQGEEVVERCQAILSEVAAISDLGFSKKAQLEGKVHLGCISTIAPFLLPRVIHAAKSHWEGLQLVLTEDMSDQLIDKLLEGKIEVALMALQHKPESLKFISLGKETMQWVAHKKHNFKYQQDLNLDQIPNHSLFMLDKSQCLHKALLKEIYVDATPKIHPNTFFDLSTLIRFTQAYQGITCIPEMALKSNVLEHSDLEIITTQLPKQEREIFLVWRQRSHRELTYQTLGQFIQAQMSTHQ